MPAKRRAFSLKQSYMSYVLNTYIIGNVSTYDSIVKEDENVYFEDIVLKKIYENIGLTIEELCKKYNIENKPKHVNSILIYRMLGVKSENAEEFEKANIEMKTVRVEKNNHTKESMSFPAIKIKKFVKEKFENSEIYKFFSEKKFLFVVFKKNEIDEYKLMGAKFWNMPIDELETTGMLEWNLYRNKFENGVNFKIEKQNDGKIIVKNDLPKKSKTKIFHLRPHASKSKYVIGGQEYGNGNNGDTDELPNGDKMTKQCFWLNNDYIIKIIKDIIIKGEEK